MKCNYTKQDGNRCDANAMIDNSFCFSHNPKTREAKLLAVRKGGLANKKTYYELTPVEIKSINGILLLLEDTINRLRTNPITPQRANSIAYICNTAIKAIETEVLETKVTEIERLVLEKERNYRI